MSGRDSGGECEIASSTWNIRRRWEFPGEPRVDMADQGRFD
jgi:hypothetical protein